MRRNFQNLTFSKIKMAKSVKNWKTTRFDTVHEMSSELEDSVLESTKINDS
jgi:hypothetical protein